MGRNSLVGRGQAEQRSSCVRPCWFLKLVYFWILFADLWLESCVSPTWQLFLSQVEMPNLGKTYPCKRTQIAMTNTKIQIFILFPFSCVFFAPNKFSLHLVELSIYLLCLLWRNTESELSYSLNSTRLWIMRLTKIPLWESKTMMLQGYLNPFQNRKSRMKT